MTTTDLIYEALREFRKDMIAEIRKEVTRQLKLERQLGPQPSATAGLCGIAVPKQYVGGTDVKPMFQPKNKIELKCPLCEGLGFKQCQGGNLMEALEQRDAMKAQLERMATL